MRSGERFSLNQISRNGNSTRVEPKAMQVLVYLGEHTGVVRKEELISTVWPNLFVSDDVLPGCISALRKAFNDNARRPRIIETIHKGGYRLLLPIEPINGNGSARLGQEVVPISWWRRAFSHRAALAIGVLTVVAVLVAAFTRAPSRTRYDSAAVLPFVEWRRRCRNGVSQRWHRRRGRQRSLATQQCQGHGMDNGHPIQPETIRTVGRDLGVKALLSGCLIRQGNRIVLNTELIDVQSGSQLWGKQYERAVSDMPALREQLSEHIAGNLRVRLSRDEQHRIQRTYNPSSAAYELCLKGRFFWNRRTKQGLQQGIDYFEQAISADPGYGSCLHRLADC